MRRVFYLTLDEALAVHDDMVDRYGGSHGLRDLGLLQSALAKPQASFGGEDLYPTILGKAAALFHSLIFNHPFVDGNKRTSFTATARFLALNGYELEGPKADLLQFPLSVENEHWSIEQIASWLEKHTKH